MYTKYTKTFNLILIGVDRARGNLLAIPSITGSGSFVSDHDPIGDTLFPASCNTTENRSTYDPYAKLVNSRGWGMPDLTLFALLLPWGKR